MTTLAVIAATVLVTHAASALAPIESTRIVELDVDGETRRFEILLETPDGYDPLSDHAVLIYSGGLTTDLHWTVPRTYEHNGATHQATTDSKDTRDADTIAAALIESGYAVARYSSIHLDDQRHAENPVLADPMFFHHSLELSELFRSAAIDELGTDPSRTFVIAHSLGATRAALTATDSAGIVTLAGAYMSPRVESPFAIVAAEPKPDPSNARDADNSGTIEPWEAAAGAALADGSYREAADSITLHNHQYPYPSDQLLASQTPILAIWGSLDTLSYHGPILEHLYEASESSDRLESEYFTSLGHSLSQEDEHGRVGPIDPRVIARIVEWISEHSED